LGLGYLPLASGTWGTLLGVLIAAAMGPLGWGWQALIAAVLAAAAVPICDAAEKHFETKDDGRIVADEYMTFPLCVIGLPWMTAPWLLAAAFVTHRLMDIAKPPPARQLQRLKGGAGVVIDDVIASLYALALNHAIWWGAGKYLLHLA
jgi:phosphatidylglycerophosphatase A